MAAPGGGGGGHDGSMSPTRSEAKRHWQHLAHAHQFGAKMKRSITVTSLPYSESMASLEELHPVAPRERSMKALVSRASSRTQLPDDPDIDARPFLPAAFGSVLLGVLSVVPYNMILKSDPGSPLFISFVLHMVIIVTNLPSAHVYVRERKFPVKYHAAIVIFGSLFTALKSDAYVRLPASVCMLLSNLRMLVGVLTQYVLFRKIYSLSQLMGVAAVTLGIAWAGNSMQSASAKASGDVEASSAFLVGVLEIFGSSLSLALLSTVVKLANSTFGESVGEQIFFQHLCAIPLVFPSQWDKVGPRFADWLAKRDYWLLFNLVASVLSTFAARRAAAAMAGRSPNLLMTQLVQTLECFLQLLVVAFLRVPPWPPVGFWGGTVVLLLGTLQYLRSSDSPSDEKRSKE